MATRVFGRREIRAAGRLILGLALMSAILAGVAATAAAQQREAPSFAFFTALEDFYEGEYVDAGREFKSEGRGAIKTVQSNWIDSICYHTMTGECHYQMGQLDEALDHYTSALQLFVAFPDWLIRVQFPPLRGAGQSDYKQVPWGQSKRAFRLASIPSTMLIQQGRINNNDVIQRGGVVQAPLLFSLRVDEIVRCTALAMRRRRELMGPAAAHDGLASDLITSLVNRPAQPNHWSQTYIDLELGLAYAAAGKNAQARTLLQRAIVAGGEFDHPHTATALYELGRIALEEGNLLEAANSLEEATYAAVNTGDAGVLEEAFRLGFTVHLISGQQGIWPPLETAPGWARSNQLQQLQASLLIMAAENAALVGDGSSARALIGQAQSAIGNRSMGVGAVGARLNYAAAVVGYQQRDLEAGDAALSAALAYQQGGGDRSPGSLWLLQIALADGLYTGGTVKERGAIELYAKVLREPNAADWGTSPLEALSTLTTPQPGPMERWFEVALFRKDVNGALEIADLARRRRFYATLPMGGRLLGLRWVLDGPEKILDPATTLERQNLLGKYPEIAALSQDAERLVRDLGQLPLVPEEPEQAKRQAKLFAELTERSLAQELLLREVAVRREPCKLAFPPMRSAKEVQSSLREGQAVLTFFATSKAVHAFVITNRAEKYDQWIVGTPAKIQARIVPLLRELGNVDLNHQMTLKDLNDDKWNELSRTLLDQLLAKSTTKLLTNLEELIIVPDGALWYCPFEAMLVADGETLTPLIAKVRVRYAPTLSLAVPDGRGRRRSAETGVVLGKLYPRDEPDVAQSAFEEFSRQVPGSVALGRVPAATPVFAARLPRLVVFHEIPSMAAGPYGWSPLPLDESGGALGQWLSLPWQGPDEVILPAFHTAAENSLKGVSPAVAGADVFLSVCGLMASGSRTVLLSRWRPAGQTSFDLVREFTEELPHASAADAWQRSVLLAMESPIHPELEPRIKLSARDEPPTAKHPFFWGGYLLVDTGTSPEEDPEPVAEAAGGG